MIQSHNPPNPNSPYNDIFERLVVNTDEESDARLIAMIAYAQYKLDKHYWIQEHPDASSEAMRGFLGSYNDRKLDKYRKEAEETLLNYAVLYAKSLDLTPFGLNLVTKEIKSIKDKISLSFWLPVWQSIVASFIFTFILFFAALTIRFAAPNSSIGKLVQYLTAPDEYRLEIIKIGQDETIIKNYES